jgi:ribosome-binding factor A
MTTRRQERVGEQIHQVISEVLQTRVRDPRLAQVTVTGVEVSPDLRQATVFVSTLGTGKARQYAIESLDHAAGFLKRELARRVELRVLPELRFMLDESWQRAARIEELLHHLPPPAQDEAGAAEPDQNGSSSER